MDRVLEILDETFITIMRQVGALTINQITRENVSTRIAVPFLVAAAYPGLLRAWLAATVETSGLSHPFCSLPFEPAPTIVSLVGC